MSLLFLADFYNDQINGGGENNDATLIHHLRSQGIEIDCVHTKNLRIENLEGYDKIIVANFVFLSQEVKQYMINNSHYLIYEHDHKYIKTRDPSKFVNFQVPTTEIVNKEFYENAELVVVLSRICEKIIKHTIPDIKVYNIGCSLWSNDFFNKVTELRDTLPKTHNLCVMKNLNPTKNYFQTVAFCQSKGLRYAEIEDPDHSKFLEKMASYNKFLFIPTVLETFSRICAEAKMLGLDVMTKKEMIGFFSEPYSHLKGETLQQVIEKKTKEALLFFTDWVMV